MKYLIIGVIIFLIYRYYNPKPKIPKGSDQFPNPPMKEPEIEDFTDYEEIE